MEGSNVVEGFGLAGQAERLLALPGPFHIMIYVYAGSRNENIFCGENSKTLKLTHYVLSQKSINISMKKIL